MSDSRSKLTLYQEQFRSVRKDKNSNKYPAHTRDAAPHKPLLLLSVLDLFAEGNVKENLIALTPSLCDLFSAYWSRVMPPERRGNIAMPFFHLTGDDFWHLVPQDGSEAVIQSGRRLRSIRKLHDHTQGARLDDALFALLSSEEPRDVLRATLIEAHFTEDVHPALFEQGTVNVESFKYSQELLQRARSDQALHEAAASPEPADPIRDQGFRRAVVDAYDHRCAISGIRILTSDYHTAVDAAHIVPWSVSHNDDPRNGLALSKLCHWTFEEGLITVSSDYVIRLSPELTADYNAPGYLGTLAERPIHLPEEASLQPDPEYLAWHRQQVFRS